MQQLRDKFAIAERTAKSEAQLKVIIQFYRSCHKVTVPYVYSVDESGNFFFIYFQEKYQLRLKVLEESLRGPSNSTTRSTPEGRSVSNGPSRRQSLGGADNISKLTSNGFFSKRTPTSQFRSSLSSSTSAVLKHAKGTSKSFDGGTRSLDRGKILLNGTSPSYTFNQSCEGMKDGEANNNWKGSSDDEPNEFQAVDTGDSVPGVMYDLLQKEVVALRKAGHEKDQSLKDKDDAIVVDFLSLLFFDSIITPLVNIWFRLVLFRC
jgi:hypothetical protein